MAEYKGCDGCLSVHDDSGRGTLVAEWRGRLAEEEPVAQRDAGFEGLVVVVVEIDVALAPYVPTNHVKKDFQQRSRPSQGGLARSARPSSQDAAGIELGVTALGGWVPSDFRRFLPLAVFRTCLAEMVFLPTRFFFASAISILWS